MSIKHSLFGPSGFIGEFGEGDASEAYQMVSGMVHVAEQAGYDTVWFPDHLQTAPPSRANLFECWTLIVALLKETTRIRIGQLVTANSYRNPLVQAKMASTADVISGGRLSFGIGSGWYEPDYIATGIEFGDAATRLKRLREAVQIIKALWTQDETTFEGRFYSIRGALHEPKGIQEPHIPIMIAGGGEKVTLKIVAEYGDACNLLTSPAELERKFAILRGHCDAVGTDYDAIRRTATAPVLLADTDAEALAAFPESPAWATWDGDVREYGLIGSPDTVRERIARYEDAGVQELILTFVSPDPVGMMRRYAAAFIGAPPQLNAASPRARR